MLFDQVRNDKANRLRGLKGARRHLPSEARQARCRARADLDVDRGRRAVCRHAVDPQ